MFNSFSASASDAPSRGIDGAAHCINASLPAKAPQRAQQRQLARLRNRCTKAIGALVFVSSVGGGGG